MPGGTLPQYRIRDLLWILIVCAITCAWWGDHRDLNDSYLRQVEYGTQLCEKRIQLAREAEIADTAFRIASLEEEVNRLKRDLDRASTELAVVRNDSQETPASN